jgi:hypothetical protein
MHEKRWLPLLEIQEIQLELMTELGGPEGVGLSQRCLLKTITRDGDGVVHIIWHGTPGASYAVEASSNLYNWSVVATRTAAPDTGSLEFTDAPAPSTPTMFYRALRP